MPADNSTIQLGSSGLQVSRIGFGCWPIAGVTTLGTTHQESIATLKAAWDSGITLFDTAYGYGYNGESDKLLAEAFSDWPSGLVLASKVGMHFDAAQNRVIDGRPETLEAHTRESLDRLNRDFLDILYLHFPDPDIPLREQASAIRGLIDSGLVRHAGVSNVNADQLKEFNTECPVAVVQPPFNMLQQETAKELQAVCETQQIGVAVYWVLMKGLLAGKLQRDHQFDPQDKRLTYPVFQGAPWHRAQDLLDVLRELSLLLECTVAQLVIAWTLSQDCVSVALCGGRRPEQIIETAGAMRLQLTPDTLARIDQAIEIATNV